MKSYLRRASASYTYSGLAVRLPIHLERAHGHDPRFWPRRLAALPQPFNILKYTLTKKRGPCCNTDPRRAGNCVLLSHIFLPPLYRKPL